MNNTNITTSSGYYGDLISNGLMIGSSVNTSVPKCLKIDVYDTLEYSSILLDIKFKTSNLFRVVQLELTNNFGINNKLNSVIISDKSSGSSNYSLYLNSEYKDNNWVIYISAVGNNEIDESIKILNITYEVLSPNVIDDANGNITKVSVSNIDNLNYNNIGELIVDNSIVPELPIGSIIPYYPQSEDSKNNLEKLKTEIANVFNGKWVLCDGSSDISINANENPISIPDLTGRFIMGYCPNDINKLVTLGLNTNDIAEDGVSNLSLYNEDKSTEGISTNTAKVNFTKIGNTGGSYTTKLLPKQQGALAIGIQTEKADMNGSGGSSINSIWISNSYNDKDITNNFQEGKTSTDFSRDSLISNGTKILNTGENKGSGVQWGVVNLAEGAHDHDNKPPYVVLAYVIRIK